MHVYLTEESDRSLAFKIMTAIEYKWNLKLSGGEMLKEEKSKSSVGDSTLHSSIMQREPYLIFRLIWSMLSLYISISKVSVPHLISVTIHHNKVSAYLRLHLPNITEFPLRVLRTYTRWYNDVVSWCPVDWGCYALAVACLQ